MLYRRLLALSLFAILSSCENYSENSLGSDQASAVKCPANGCANASASTNELNIIYSGATSLITPKATDLSIQIGGDCYPSTYVDNRINVQVKYSVGGALISPVAYSTLAANPTTIRCDKGRYSLTFANAALPSGYAYDVTLTLVGLDANNIQYTGGINVAYLKINKVY